MRIHSVKVRRVFSTLVILPALAVSVAAQQINSLSINGQSGSAKVVRVGGRNFVEVEGLTRITNSAISYSGNQIVLTLHGGAADASAAPAPAPGFSKEFITAGIEAMAQIREWRAALRNAIQRSYPISDDWLSGFRNQSQQAIRLATVAASTNADKGAVPFLTNELSNMNSLTDKYLQLATSRTYIEPDALESDPLDQKIRACGRSLASMATANQLADDGSCQ